MAAVAMRGRGRCAFVCRMFSLTLAATACALAAPAAHAFTMENKDAAGQYAVPKFDLEEQAKNFRKDGAGAASTGKSVLRDAARQRHAAFRRARRVRLGFGSVFSPGLGPAGLVAQHRGRTSTASLAPPTSLEYNGVR